MWSAIALTYDIRLELAHVDRIVAEIFLFHFFARDFLFENIFYFFEKIFYKTRAQKLCTVLF